MNAKVTDHNETIKDILVPNGFFKKKLSDGVWEVEVQCAPCMMITKLTYDL